MPEKRKVQLSEVIDRILDLRAYEMRVNNIEVIKKFYPDCPPLLVDESQIEQVFLNIIINAEQAMLEAHGKGCLEVETRWDTMRDVVKISFHDDGPGIPKEHLLKVFDPFFTTKPIGKGTGLGLSIAYGIVREHGGLITAVREKDQGSTFTVELPVAEDEIPENITVPPQPGKIAKVGNKKILVVDDEAAIVDLVRATLEEEGYLVETANDGNSAVRKIEEGSFDAVVSDLKMPGKGGTDIYMYCKDKKPELAGRFLLLTGDVAGSSALRLMKEHQVLHLEKPLDLRDLISYVNILFNAD